MGIGATSATAVTSATASDNVVPTGRIDRLVQDYVRRRRGVSELPRDLEYKRIFVLPTRFGFWFGVLLLLMIVGGLNFNNNMTLMLAFLLGEALRWELEMYSRWKPFTEYGYIELAQSFHYYLFGLRIIPVSLNPN